ncbi:sensor histidine kinase [Demequina zhanjiangensis]|uniref:histidine kinase n=1 Tax=Demequina zhanjiangensis TaxID=3051659 RepID=A0ABT8G0B2_9MICO|nr:sensor histidine kinase [Demequina sp. SYSU T00b26]MDN4472573.1 sensor histidine kinase [Demequina sp. SYSU T00b26]
MASLAGRLPLPPTQRGRDALGAGVVLILVVWAALPLEASSGGWWFKLVASIAASVALVWRRDAPLLVLAVSWVAFALPLVILHDFGNAYTPFLIAVYTAVSRSGGVRRALLVGLIGTLAAGAPVVVSRGWNPWDVEVILAGVLAGLVAALGLAMAMYRRALAQERARAVEAEETKEALAETRVAQERLRIARELHDAVGHHIAVMNVQAGVAEALLESDKERAADALANVQEAGARALEELPLMLRVLRQDGDDDERPGVGLAQLDELVAHAREAGLDVVLDRRGAEAVLPTGVDQAAYRIVQEALTNAQKHGVGTAAVTVEATADEVRIEVGNRVAEGASVAPASGFGLVGMKERATAVGGAVTAAREGDSFVVCARLPMKVDQERGTR